MKTKLNILLAVLAMIMLLPTVANAYNFMSNGLAYNINSDGTSVTVTREKASSLPTYTSLRDAVTIPSQVTYSGKTYTVTAIDEYAFNYCSYITSVTIANTVTSIGNSAFSQCTGLTSVTIPGSVTSIGDATFYNCSSLLGITIPNSVTEIGRSAFYGCIGLTSATIGNAVRTIGEHAFHSCSGLTSIDIPNSVTSIGKEAFHSCSGLKNVTISSSVTSIAEDAFGYCTGLSSIIIDEENTVYDSRNNCNAIVETATNTLILGCKNSIIPNTVTAVGNSAFSNCTGLTSMDIPNSVTSIGHHAFYGCTGLKSVTIPNTITEILRYSFYDCKNLKNVTIPNSVITIEEDAFCGCSGMTSLTIGNSVATIGKEAFRGCVGLTSVTIPGSVTSIDNYAFYHSNKIKNVTIGNSVRSIGGYAFCGCSSLTSVTIPNAVATIGKFAFNECKINTLTIAGNGNCSYGSISGLTTGLTTLNVGSGITSLGAMNIAPAQVNCYAAVPPTCVSNTFSNYNGELHVPENSTAAYFTANYWKNFNNLNNDLTETVTLSQTAASLTQWDVLTLSANIYPQNAEVKWSTSNSQIATVGDEGAVTAIAAGECDILATLSTNDAVYASCHVTVSYPEISLSLNQAEAQLSVTDQLALTATITPGNTGLSPEWSMSDASVATVTDDGVVTAVGEGECDITATVLDKTATCHVTVDAPQISLSLNEDSVQLRLTDQLALTLTITPDIPGLTTEWTTSDASVATVTGEGVVTAVGEGECDITATVLDKTATCHVTVDGTVTISLDTERAIIKLNQIVTLYPACSPDVEVDFTVSSSDNGVAMARVINRSNAPGEEPAINPAPALAGSKAVMVVGMGKGKATITVASADGSAIPATFEVTVIDDVNGDGQITVADVTCIYDVLLGTSEYSDKADVNGDGEVTVADVTLIYNAIMGVE